MNDSDQRQFSYFVLKKREKSHRACHPHRRRIDVGLCWSSLARVGEEGGVTRKGYGGSKPIKLSREAKRSLAK